LSRGFRAQISRSGAQKTHFQLSVRGQSGRTDFFNSIGRFLPVTTGSLFPVTGKWGRIYFSVISSIAVANLKKTKKAKSL
jgi:hypothetical protein